MTAPELDLDAIEEMLAHPLDDRPWRNIVRSLLVEVRRIRSELGELEWAEVLTEQGCAEGRHTEWYADTENLHTCPWCEVERLTALVEQYAVQAGAVAS